MIALSLLLASVTLGPVKKAPMDSAIGNRTFERRQPSVYDSKQGVYLYEGYDCDGAHKRITLSSDLRSILTNEGRLSEEDSTEESKERFAESLREIKSAKVVGKTNRGIRLGMSQQEVIRVLGKPAKAFWSKRFLAKELIYTRQTPLNKAGMGVAYTNYYLFRGDKLCYIELSQDAIGEGC